jgi:hypothetical protein
VARHLPNLPAEVTSFVGRRRELREVKRLLGTTRLLTLTGSGGAGKTKLAAGETVPDLPFRVTPGCVVKSVVAAALTGTIRSEE